MSQVLLAADCAPSKSFLPSLYKGIPADSSGNCSFTSLQDIVTVLANVVQILLTLAGVLAVVFVIVGAIQYILSTGEPAKVNKAKSTIAHALIGLALSAGAFIIVGLITRQLTQ